MGTYTWENDDDDEHTDNIHSKSQIQSRTLKNNAANLDDIENFAYNLRKNKPNNNQNLNEMDNNTKHLEDNFNNIINDINKDHASPTFNDFNSNKKGISSTESNQKLQNSNNQNEGNNLVMSKNSSELSVNFSNPNLNQNNNLRTSENKDDALASKYGSNSLYNITKGSSNRNTNNNNVLNNTNSSANFPSFGNSQSQSKNNIIVNPLQNSNNTISKENQNNSGTESDLMFSFDPKKQQKIQNKIKGQNSSSNINPTTNNINNAYTALFEFACWIYNR
jgi:hypothetical protein